MMSPRNHFNHHLEASIMRFLALVGLVLSTVLAIPLAASAETDSDMLERTIGGVVTVAVYKSSDLNQPFGFGGSDAYEKLLDLSGATCSGSGFCIEHNGKKYIITNCHVIEGATSDAGAIACFNTSATKYPMKIAGADSFIDIAVLEFADKQPGPEISPLKFTTDQPRLGQKVFAIGNPYGEYPYAVSDGIIGGLNRVRDELTGKFGYLESTATVAWGNSGGPLVNEAGDVVGINTGIEIRSRFNQFVIQPQINFALQASSAMRAINDIIDAGHVRRPFLGVSFSQDFGISKENNQTQTYSLNDKPIIGDILPGSPADGPLTPFKGAVVTRINDQTVGSIEEVLAAMEGLSAGADCTLWLDHNGQTDKVTIKAQEMTVEHSTAWAQRLLSQRGVTITQTKDGVFAAQNREEPSQKGGNSGPNVQTAGAQTGNDQVTTPLQKFLQQFQYQNQQHGFKAGPPPGPQQASPQTPQGPQEIPIIALGVFDDDGNAVSCWRVNNLNDLGMAIRIAAEAGKVDLATHGDNGKLNLLRVWLSGDEKKLSQTLLY